jgi:hypothetical protein
MEERERDRGEKRIRWGGCVQSISAYNFNDFSSNFLKLLLIIIVFSSNL